MRLILALALWLTTNAAVAAADGRVTDLVTTRCKVLAVETEDEAGVPLRKAEHYASAWRCDGIQGRYVYIRYGDQREDIAFGGRRGPTTPHMEHDHFGSWGPTIEWRGTRAKSGQLEVYAAIAPYRWDIRNGGASGGHEIGGELAVIRLGKGRTDTCILAWVDMVANADAMELARKAADERARRHVCSAAKAPEHLGKRSKADRE